MPRRPRGGTFRRSSRRGAPRRTSKWVDFFVNETITTGSQQVADLTGLVEDQERKGMTLVRIIAKLTYLMIAAGTGGKIHNAILFLAQDAVNSLVFPDVDDVGEQVGWLWRNQTIHALSAANKHDEAVVETYDLHPRRTLLGNDMAIVLLWDAESLTASVNVDGLLRMLFLLP